MGNPLGRSTGGISGVVRHKPAACLVVMVQAFRFTVKCSPVAALPAIHGVSDVFGTLQRRAGVWVENVAVTDSLNRRRRVDE